MASLLFMNSSSKTESAIFRMKAMLPTDFPFSQIYLKQKNIVPNGITFKIQILEATT